MAKQLNVSLAFSADTNKAKAQLKDLQSQLNNLSNNTILKVDVDNSEIHSAVQDIAKLQAQLKSSMNQKTGLLDLGKFNESMAKSNMSLEKYQKTLSSLGSDGQKAFLSLTNSIINAETPLRRTNALLDEMKTTLANTARWQLSSSILHGFMGAVQGAYGYAQDLNESLNNIRIVTGQSVDQMAKFAKEANTAAKALSTTTTEYTDAALIYYQQGLNDQQVKERTDVTVKMANVSRQGAETVSDQMTSVWNNFYDGSKSLEYYSDVMVELGAATASSSEEIATGLEKFSAVSNTVGLSYEYAAAALATVTAQTRQSADTVGTAFRTLFTRLEGLNLGETADDGTTLNKYSEALFKVGVNIKDQQGQLKDMDQILDELGAKWSTIGKEQQVALAQTVGGARQYATLIALMDNWDFFQENLSTAYGSSGALQEQADIYAESWEAARDRVTAALEDIYDSLLKDDFFIGITDRLATVLNLIGDVIDGMGGFTGVLSLASTLAIKLFSKDIAKGLENFGYNLKSLTGLNKKENLESKTQAITLTKEMVLNSVTAEGDTQNTIMKNEGALLALFAEKAELMSSEQKATIQHELDTLKILEQQLEKKAQLVDLTEEEARLADEKARREAKKAGNQTYQKAKNDFRNEYNKFKNDSDLLDSLSTEKKLKGHTEEDKKNLLGLIGDIPIEKDEIDDYSYLLELAEGKIAERLNDAEKQYLNTTGAKSTESLYESLELAEKAKKKNDELSNSVENVNKYVDKISEDINSFGEKTYTWTEKLTAIAQIGGSIFTLATTITGVINTLNDDSLTPWEKFTTILGTVVMVAPMLITTIGSAIPVIKGATAATAEATIAIGGASVAVNSLIWPISAVVIGLTALIALWAWFETEHSFTGQLKKANEELERMQKAAANTSSSYEDLKSSINSLNSAEETLAGLTKGTEEWNDAVLKLNQQVLDLIDAYPELAKYMSTEDGVLSLSKEGVEAVIASQREQAQAMQAAVLNQQRNVLALENERIKKETEGISFKQDYLVDEGIDGQTGEQKYRIDTKTINFTAETLASIGKQILDNDALNSDNTIDFNKIEPGLQQFESALNENIDTILSLATQFESLDNQLSIMDENLASSWLNSIGIDGEFNEFLSKGMAKSADNYRSQTEFAVNAASKDEVIAAYAKITGSSITAIEDAIANEKITLEDLKDTVITNSINTQAFQEYENQLNSLSDLKGQAGYETLKNIIASGGDESSYNALTDGQLKELQQLLFTDQDGTLKSNIAELFDKNPKIFGEGFSQKLSQALTDANYKANAEAERNKRHQEKVLSTATALGVNEEALEDFVNHLEASEEGLKGNKEAALEAAEAIIRYNRGAEKLAETFKNNEEALKETNKGTWEYYEALGKIQQAASEMFGLDLNTEYVEEHLDDLRKAAEGDETAIKNLQSTMATSWAKDFAAGVENGTNLLTEQAFNAEDWRNRFTSSVEAVNASLASMSDSFTLEEALAKGDQSVKNLIDTVNEAAAAGKMSAEEIDALFGSMGYSPEITWTEVPGPSTSWTATAYPFGEKFPITVAGETSNNIAVPQIDDADSSGSTSFIKISTAKSLSSNIKAGGNKTSGSQKDAKKNADEIERYHVIKEQMEDINNELDKINKAKDRAFGGDKLKLMDDEIAKTEELVEAQKAYLDEIEAYYNKDKAAIAAYGAQFDMNGVITNYDALIAAQVAKFNAARTDAAEEEFEKFKDVLEQYEETSDLVAEQRQELIDQENKLADLLLEKLQYEIELKIEISDDDLKYLDYLLKQVDDSAYEAADAIALLGQKTQKTLDNIDTYSEGINKLFQNHGFVGDITELLGDNSTDLLAIAEAYNFTEAEVETLREYRDGLMESTENLMDLQQEIRDKVIPAFEDLTAEMDEEIDKLDHLSSMLNHYKNIIDIVGKDTLGITDEMMASLETASVDNAINQLESSYSKLEGMRQSRAEVQKQLNDAYAEGNEDLIKYWEDTLAEIDAQLRDAESDWASTWESTLEAIADAYDSAVQRSIERFEEAMSGTYGNFEALQDAYDKQQEVDKRYLEDYEQIYELNKLNRDISNSIDNTDNIKGKQMLIELQKEINDLENAGVKLSEYDVNFLRQKYELRLAEIALEEAQNAKSQVRMTRDSEGNWSYTYTADEQNIADAQQNYEDVLYETQKLSTEYINNLQGQIIDAQVAMNTELAQLRADDEEGRQRVIEHYQGQIDYLTSQLEGALANNEEIYTRDWQAYHDATGYKISDQEDYLIRFDQTNLSIMSGFDTVQEYQDGFTEACSILYDEIGTAAETWRERTEQAMQAAGTSVETFAQDLDTAVNGSGGIVDQSNAAKDSVVSMGQQMSTTFGTVLQAVDNFETNYGHLINGVIADNNVLINSCNDIIKAWAAVDAAEKRQSFNTYNPQTGGTTDVSVKGGFGGGLEGPSGSGNKESYYMHMGVRFNSLDQAQNARAQYEAGTPGWAMPENYDHDIKAYDKYGNHIASYHTGGYTGAWGTFGKLAMLHEKELVLNKQDTKNILDSVEIVRSISEWLGMRAQAMQFSMLGASNLSSFDNRLEQDITIHAEFPNANNKEEIKAAFSDLANRAAQFANRKG